VLPPGEAFCFTRGVKTAHSCWVSVCAALVTSAGVLASPATPEDPVVGQARALLVARHPSGERLATVLVTGSRRERIEALLSILGDPSTRLLPAKAWAPFLAEVSGQRTVGVGLRELLDLDLSADRRLVVITTQPGGPAARAGIAPPDVLERIDGKAPRDLTDAMARLRGAAGTDVMLALRRGDEARTMRLRRIALPAAGDHVRAATLDGGLLEVAIDGFSPATPGAVQRALEGARRGGVVLDLRNNPGGAVDAVLAVAGLLVGERDVVRAVGRGEPEVLRSKGSARAQGRVAVLVNAASASAAELLAIALRESGRGRLFGERTAGKALVHVPAPLDDGSVLLISTARLVRLDGTEILGRGLEPDERIAWPASAHPPLPVPGHPGQDPQLAAALSWLHSS
jgi:carboxyl-terminal processing protease